jgi:hypothetical protein
MSRLLAALFCLAAAGAAARAEPPSSAADATERGRDLARILDAALLPAAGDEGADRAVLLLLDPTESLRQASFAAAFEQALSRNAGRLGRTRVAVARTGAEPSVAFRPAAQAAALAEAARAVEGKPSKEIQNLYADARRAAGALGREAGRREMILVSLENGDAVDDVEITASTLKRAGIRLSVVAREAFLSDTFWLTRGTRPPRDLEFYAGDAAFIEVPWGFLFQQSDATQVVPSGFPVYGLSRLAAVTGGKVYLFYPPSGAGHQCTPFGSCLFCTGDHIPFGESYEAHRLRALAPLSTTEGEALAAAGRDPYFRAVLRAWGRAADEGLVRSRPSVRGAGGALRAERRPVGAAAAIGGNLSWSSQASKADELARAAEAIARDLETEIGAVTGDGLDRYRAIADYTRLMLRVTRVNLLLFAGFCREAGPALAAGECGPPPELPWYAGQEDLIGIGYSSLSLCHGVRPFLAVRLPGGEAVKKEIAALAPLADEYLSRYAFSPFGAALRRAGFARFSFTVRGTYVPPPDRRTPGSKSDETPTETDRPARGGGSGSGGGATTEGG